ncbi:hypothetical protein BEWA_050670 [Theileria equi strain WA]|uniref:Uncharacterized protein n=1 Tax=Theileria equi strain WA TaxID=1537102 RepID=L1LBE8_THEEQ|nr:hypothetical protein BEWA_050670 [Theileria equi strain WA]EKX72599.1 hypothetical protein BEWA_050670 [Theileria equi strain WA]|eukprot:XP_004832051.1 hypothetical protein BEWA_050670 [Theileria equi strain WA]
MSAQSGVTINIREKPPEDQKETTYPPGSGSVKVTREEDPLGSGFLKFTHSPSSGNTFRVENVLFGGTPVLDIGANTGDDIQYLAVWYWFGDGSHNQPLLAEVLKGGQYIYRSSKGGGTSWSPLSGKETHQHDKLTGKELEQKLDDLNCQHNNAVTLNLTFHNSSTLSEQNVVRSGRNTYCCSGSHNGGKRVSVEKVKVRCTRGHNSADCYKHEIISGGSRVAKIRYYLGNTDTNTHANRRRITSSNELQFPITSSVSVYALYCKQNPVLIYVEGDGNNGTNEWYQKPTGSSNGNEEWTRVGNLNGITPGDFGKLECNQWNKLREALNNISGCTGLRICSIPPPPPPPPLPGGAGPIEPSGSGATGGDPIAGLLGKLLGRFTSRAIGIVSDKELLGNLADIGKIGLDIAGTVGKDTIEATAELTKETLKKVTATSTTTTTDHTPEALKTEPQPALPGESTPTIPSTPLSPAGSTTPSPPPHNASQGQEATSEPIVQVPLAAGMTLGSILGTSSGTLAGAGGLTGFGWWMFKRSRGDPWVRQI